MFLYGQLIVLKLNQILIIHMVFNLINLIYNKIQKIDNFIFFIFKYKTLNNILYKKISTQSSINLN